MITLIIVCLAIALGAYVLLRTPPPAGKAATLGEGDAARLRAAVLAKLRDRLAGWTFEELAGEPLQVVAVDSATERRLILTLEKLAAEWQRLVDRGLAADADALVEAFVQGATGEGASDEADADASWAREALALRLVSGGKVPPGCLSRPAGPLAAVLVVRSPEGAQPAGPDDLETWEMSAEDAFAAALANHAADVTEGVSFDVLEGEAATPRVVRLAPGDPLAASLALVPQLGDRLRERLGMADVQLVLTGPGEIYALGAGAQAPAHATPILAGPLAPGSLGWKG